MSENENLFAKMSDWYRHQVRLFFIALQFFTRFPTPQWVGYQHEWLQQSSRYFVLVGLLVGGVVSAVYAGASLAFPPLVAVLISTIFGIVLTGAFHEDGFADVCDGLGGAVSAERALDIMKDSRIGAYGTIGVVLMLALKVSTLASLPTPSIIAALVIAHPLSRLAATAFIWRLNYVRAEGKSKPLAQRMSSGEFSTAASFGILPMLLCGVFGWLNWASILCGAVLLVLSALYLWRVFVRRIGGYTGDCLGAVQQLAEVSFYLGLLSCA